MAKVSSVIARHVMSNVAVFRRYQFIAQHGADEMVVGIDKVRQEITKDSSVVSIILDLQCVLLVITYALCAR